jgi:hypothetical protein
MMHLPMYSTIKKGTSEKVPSVLKASHNGLILWFIITTRNKAYLTFDRLDSYVPSYGTNDLQ